MNKTNKIVIALVGLALLGGLGVALWRLPMASLAQFRSLLQTPPSSVSAQSPLQTPTSVGIPAIERPTPLPPIPLPTPRITPTPPTSQKDISPYDARVPLRAEGIALAAVQPLGIGDFITFKSWSPDGEQFLFGRSVQDYLLVDNGGGVGTHASWQDLWVANADGSNPRKLADIVNDWAWSPDGHYVAYLAPLEQQGITGGLYIVDIRRLRPRKIANCDLGGWDDVAWLPSGEITCRQNGVMYAIRSDGSQIRQLNEIFSSDSIAYYGEVLPPVFQGHYRISPDGEKVAYIKTGDSPSLRVSNLDGSNSVEVGTRLGMYLPVWSPNSEQLAYDVFNGNGRVGTELWVVNADGSNPHRIAVAEYEDAQCLEPAWSPDSRVIAYSYWPHLPSEPESVWIVNADGTNPHLLVDLAFAPQWSPKGNRIAVLRRWAAIDTPESLLLLVSLGQ